MKGTLSSLILSLGLASCGSNEICDPGELTNALAEAEAGETITIGACSISGQFTLKEGNHLKGQSREQSRIVAPDSGIVIAEGGQLSDLTIQIDGPGYGVFGSADGGSATLANLSIEATRGIGIGLEGFDSVALSDVSLTGPVTRERATVIAQPSARDQIATHGLVLVRVSRATLTNVTVNGFATVGALLAESEVVWDGGNASDNLNTGLLIEGRRATLKNLSICRTMESSSAIPSFGAVSTATAAVETTNLEVCDGGAYGWLHNGGTATHENLTISGQQDAAIWAQYVNALDLSGSITNNRFAGLVAIDTKNLSLQNVQFNQTAMKTRLLGQGATHRVGDGIHLVRATENAALSSVLLEANERAGLFIELDGGSLDTATFTDVSVTIPTASTAESAGAVAQGGTIRADWDDGITRIGTTRAQDALKDLTFVIGPCDHPKSELVGKGLDALK